MTVKKNKIEKSQPAPTEPSQQTQQANKPQIETQLKPETQPAIQQVQKTNKMPYFIIPIIAIIIIAGIFFLTNTENKEKTPEIAAVINEKVITLDELNKIYDKIPEQARLFTTKENILNELIQKELLYQEATKQGIIISEYEAKGKLALAKIEQGITDEEFTQRIAEQGITEDELIKEYAKSLTIEKFINDNIIEKTNVSDKEAKDYYNSNKDQFKVDEQVTVKHVLIGNQELSTEEKEQKAKSLLSEINTDNFCDYVKKHSTDTASIEKCGEYTFTKNDPLVQEFKDLSFNQSAGKIGTVNTQFGTHIIWTVKKTPPKTLTFNEVKDQLRKTLITQLAQQKYTSFYEELKQANNIDIQYVESAVKQ